MSRPRVAVFKLASCDGCQLQLLDAEEALLLLATRIDIVDFAEATSHSEPGPYDIVLIEGSVSTSDQVEQVKCLRADARYLIAIGACATSGGIQALRNLGDIDETTAAVYPEPTYVKTLAMSEPVSEFVRTDLELTGCPIDRGELLNAISSLLARAVPRVSTSPVCIECKRGGYPCVIVSKGEPCLGPATRTGCGALCPAFGRGCYGCFGPARSANPGALAKTFAWLGLNEEQVERSFRFITGWAPGFRGVPKEDDAA
jgi:coenzyme F420-reducing hydrogenase gamma subunit